MLEDGRFVLMSIGPVNFDDFPFVDVWGDGGKTNLFHPLNGNLILSQKVFKLRGELLRAVEGS